MNLTGDLFLALLILLTIGAFTGVILLWRRLSGRNWRAVLGRVGVLGGAQLMVVVLVAALANDYFGFYGSWHDLFGFATQTQSVFQNPDQVGTRGRGTGTALGAGGTVGRQLLSVQSISGLNLPSGTAPAVTGQTQNVTIQGAVTGLSTQAIVYFPPQYFQQAYQDYRFPVAIISTGYPGDLQALENRLKYPYRLLTGLNGHTDRPVVLVMTQPSPTSVGGTDTECTNVPGGPQVNTFWAQDIPTALEQAYPRLATDARSWGLMGDSTGGDCALKVSMMNSDRFGVAVSLSGDYNAPEDITTGNLYQNQQFRDENNVMWRLRNLAKPPIAVLLASSLTGENDISAVQEFVRLTRGTPLRTSTLLRNEGGHNFATWNAEIAPALQWLTNTLTSPTPLPRV
ncbi:hypothetical protein KDL01_03630 [Actinospica durhamensis]|uniref:Esterase n=1 Tax=Actinospica durhamensis TaxID=1508375 RepID=A0A941INR7_9ACTN|nr:alpha/beta hydrolase-fold protein [Actinospica durhamensis]MBR7832332.1 hypothetical protein [Actinospica durhamensis]